MNDKIIKKILDLTNNKYDIVDLNFYIGNLDLQQFNQDNLIAKFINLFFSYQDQGIPLPKIINRTYGTLILEHYAGDTI